MSEWPSAPRLKETLERRAQGATARDDALGELHRRIASHSADDVESTRRSALPYLAVAAALVLIIGLAFIFARNDGQSPVITDDVVDESPAPSITAAEPPIEPENALGDWADCATLPREPMPFRASVGEATAVIAAAQGGAPELLLERFYVLADRTWEEQAERDRIHQDLNDGGAVVYVEEAASLTDSQTIDLIEQASLSFCATMGSGILVAGPASVDPAVRLACDEAIRPGISALVLAGSPASLPACVPNRTILMTPEEADSAATQNWFDHYGCQATERSDGDDRVTVGLDCQTSLVHVATGNSPWETAPIDGLGFHDFFLRLLDSPQ